MNGRPARADELWIACASKVFPVPVSPRSTIGTSDFAASAASCKHRAMASLLVVRSSILSLKSGSRMANYCFILSRNCRIGSNAYSISVRLPTMMCASPRIPTRRGKICPARGEITERSSEASAMKCEPSLEVTADGLIQSSFPVTAP